MTTLTERKESIRKLDAYYYSNYAWALLNGACDKKTQDEFDSLALVPIPWSNVSRR